MQNALKTFVADEAGAITIDWVVLTAAVIGLGLAVMGVIRGGVEDLSTDISDTMSEYSSSGTF